MSQIVDAWTPNRHPAGSPSGGQFAPAVHTAPSGTLRLYPWDVPDNANVVLGDFLDEHDGQPSPSACRAFLQAPPERQPNIHDEDHEWRCAMRAVSAMIAEGQGGQLREIQDLKVGDRVDLSRLWTNEDQPDELVEFAYSSYPTVIENWGCDGEGIAFVKVRSDDGVVQTVMFPEGTAIPVVS